jgi:hypothetical protein
MEYIPFQHELAISTNIFEHGHGTPAIQSHIILISVLHIYFYKNLDDDCGVATMRQQRFEVISQRVSIWQTVVGMIKVLHGTTNTD